jgi:uncharacterized NAD-dependent epimerase/dehydratase family protein
MADKLVLCHEAGREVVHGYEDTELPPVEEYVDLYESLAAPVHETEVVAGALNTRSIDDDEAAREAVEAFGDAIGGDATDPVRFGADEIVEALR